MSSDRGTHFTERILGALTETLGFFFFLNSNRIQPFADPLLSHAHMTSYYEGLISDV